MSTAVEGQTIDTLLLEERRYPPPPEFTAQANAKPDIYSRSFENFWETEGRERVTWFEPFTELLEWELPYAKWYVGGKLNVCFNCVDRHVEAGKGDKGAFYWEGEPAAPQGRPWEPMDAEDLLYLLYTSGTTAKPKGIVHTTGGYLVGVATTHHYIFDVKPDSIYWCAADVGWVTGHSYIVYGPLCNGVTSVLYEGTPDFPDKDRWWSIVERYQVTVLYTAPTAIRAHMKWGTEYAERHDLSSLRLLGSVGEPINPEAWVWYHEHVGGDRTPVVDT